MRVAQPRLMSLLNRNAQPQKRSPQPRLLPFQMIWIEVNLIAERYLVAPSAQRLIWQRKFFKIIVLECMAGHIQETQQSVEDRLEALKTENTPPPVPRDPASTSSKAGVMVTFWLIINQSELACIPSKVSPRLEYLDLPKGRATTTLIEQYILLRWCSLQANFIFLKSFNLGLANSCTLGSSFKSIYWIARSIIWVWLGIRDQHYIKLKFSLRRLRTWPSLQLPRNVHLSLSSLKLIFTPVPDSGKKIRLFLASEEWEMFCLLVSLYDFLSNRLFLLHVTFVYWIVGFATVGLVVVSSFSLWFSQLDWFWKMEWVGSQNDCFSFSINVRLRF